MTSTKSSLFWEIHKDLPRQGPGNNESTARAFKILSDLPDRPRILDIGCGPGVQTVELARLSNGKIVALDLHPHFLEETKQNAEKAGQGEKKELVEGSMFEMSFEEESFDVIWSEGAIFIIGFEKGLKEWKKFLKQNGYMVASHLSWLKSDIPEEPRLFWEKNFPEINTIENNLKIAESNGYKVIGNFTLPEEGWWEYELAKEKNLKQLGEKYKEDKQALTKINNTQEEIDLYRKYSDCFGYVFYILRKVD